MLRWRLRPAHGWQDFTTELAIVVLGVLIALGAQQAVEAWQTRRDVADFREALRDELGRNLGAYQGRSEQSLCLKRRLDQLDGWQRDWRDGAGPALWGEIGRPLAFTLNFSVWRSGLSGVAAKLPLKERLFYARIYDSLESYDVLRSREVASWQGLFAFDHARRLTSSEVNTLRGLILSARSIDRSMQANWKGIKEFTARQGLKPVVDPGRNALDNGLCTPLRLAGRA